MKNDRIYRLTTTAVLAALALALSFVESLLPPLPVPGARLGLANLVVMYAIADLSVPCAAGITAVKAVFALLRGPVACLMSTAGGLAALLVMVPTYRLLRNRLSFIGVGVLGAVAHNIGQLTVSLVLLGSAMWYYAPLLLLMAVPTGIVTGLVLNVTYPHLRQFSR